MSIQSPLPCPFCKAKAIKRTGSPFTWTSDKEKAWILTHKDWCYLLDTKEGRWKPLGYNEELFYGARPKDIEAWNRRK